MQIKRLSGYMLVLYLLYQGERYMKLSFNQTFHPAGLGIKNKPVESIPDEDPVFRIGETVMHPSEGICTIEELKHMDFSNTTRAYYILKPLAEKSSSTVYMPVFRGNHMLRRLLTKDTILRMIQEAAHHESLWIDDNKQRKDVFTHILSEGNHLKIIKLIQELHEHRILREQEGRKNCAADENILAEAERRLHQEFSHVLHMNLEETTSFVRQNLSDSGFNT